MWKPSFYKGSIYLKAESKKRASYLTCKFVYFYFGFGLYQNLAKWLRACSKQQKKSGDNIGGDRKNYKKYEVSIVIALSHFI